MSKAGHYETSPEDPEEMAMAAAYGKAGFKRCTETKEYDEWLDTFDVVLDDFKNMERTGHGSFPTNDQITISEGDRERILDRLSELSEAAEEIKSKSLEERQEMDINHLIDLSDSLRDDLQNLKNI